MYAYARDAPTHTEGSARVDLGTGLVVAEGLVPQHLGGATGADQLFDGSSDGQTIAFVAETETEPRDIWKTDGSARTMARVTRLNPDLNAQAFGATKLIRWRTNNGQDLAGTLILPVGYVAGHAYPTVVIVYPGLNKSNLVHHFILRAAGRRSESSSGTTHT